MGNKRIRWGALCASAGCLFAAFAVATTQAQVTGPIALDNIPIIKNLKKGFATETTQWFNNLLLSQQLHEDLLQTGQLVKIDEQTMRSLLTQPVNTHEETERAVDAVRMVLGAAGVPYWVIDAIGDHEVIFNPDPAEVITYDKLLRVARRMMDAQDRAILDAVISVATQSGAAEVARDAVEEAVGLSQDSLGQTQAIVAGNQINAAVFGKLDSIQSGLQAAAYAQARKDAAAQAELRIADTQRAHDTRDFITGPYPTAGGGGIGEAAASAGVQAAVGLLAAPGSQLGM